MGELTSAGDSQVAKATLALRQLLLGGRFRPGERLREIPLAAELQVSRIPLRLALERLAHEGLLEIRPTRGFIVQQFSADDIFDAIELRGNLEGMAARLAAQRLGDKSDLAAMYKLDREMRQAVQRRNLTLENFKSYVDLNARFHTGLIALSKSRLLQRAMERICYLPFASPGAFLRLEYFFSESRDLIPIALDQHQQILQAIETREAARSESVTKEHARLARRNLENALRNHELQLVPGAKLIRLSEAG
jgi:GntR family transcriptional regulator of vanillate catabolism